MQCARRNQDHIPIMGLVGMGAAQIVNIAGDENYQFIIIMIMQLGGVGLPGIIGAAIGIEQGIIDGIFSPIDNGRMLGTLKIQVMG